MPVVRTSFLRSARACALLAAAALLSVQASRAHAFDVTIHDGAVFDYSPFSPFTGTLSFGTGGGTLEGTGVMSAAGGVTVNNGGIIAPGVNAPGSQSYTTGLTFLAGSGGSTYKWEHTAGNAVGTAGTSFDEIVLAGSGNITVNSGSALSLNFANTTDFTNAFWDANQSWSIIRYSSGTGVVSGTFTNANIFLNGSVTNLVNASNVVSGQGTFSTAIFGGNLVLKWTIAGPATTTWIANSGTGLWSTAANWSFGVPNAAGATATFDGTGALGAVNVDANKISGRLLISGSVAYTLSNNAITMNNTGGTGTNAVISSSSAVTQVINSQIITSFASHLDVSSTGGGTLSLGGGIDNTQGKTVTLNATGGSSLIVGAIINNGTVAVTGSGSLVTLGGAVSGTGALTQNGNTLFLAAASGNSYGSGTTLTSGTMLASNTSGSATGTGGVTLNGGTLGGHGIITGTVSAGSSAHTIAPGATLPATSVGTLTLGGLTTSTNTTMTFSLVNTGSFDSLHITGGLNVSAGGHLSFIDSGAQEGYYKIIKVDGGITGNANALTVPTIVTSPAGKEAYVIDTFHDAGYIDIHKTLIGDGTGDGIVDGADFDVWFTHLLNSTHSYEQGDYNGDGLVDGADFDVWFTHLLNTFGGQAPSGNFTESQLTNLANFLTPEQMATLGPAVPEPASLALLGLGAAALVGRRRR